MHIQTVLRPAAALLAIAAVFGLAMLMAPPATAQETPEGLDSAIQQYVEDRGDEYAGDCDAADIDQDIGKWCSTVQSASEGTATVRLGETFSEFSMTVTFEQTNGDWVVASEEEEDRVDPPGTGTGLAPETGQSSPYPALAAGAAAFLAIMAAFLGYGRMLTRRQR